MPTLSTFIIDSPSLIYRAFFAIPGTQDSQTNYAIRGYLDMMNTLVNIYSPREIIHTFDADWRPAWRVAIYSGYKANRPPEPQRVTEQAEALMQILASIGQKVVTAQDYEADDVIGTLAAKADSNNPVKIVTGDRDLLQLVCDPHVQVLFTLRGVSKLRVFDENEVRQHYGIPPRSYVDFAILRGDNSDNLPGIAGIGEKTAAKLIAQYRSIDNLLGNLSNCSARIAQAIDAGRQYIQAMNQVVPVKCSVDLETLTVHEADFMELAKEYRVEKSVERLRASLALTG